MDNIDFGNYKGIFYDEPSEKYQDEITGAHFEYFDMCLRLKKLKKKIEIEELTSKPEEVELIELEETPGKDKETIHLIENPTDKKTIKIEDGNSKVAKIVDNKLIEKSKASRNKNQELLQQGYGTVGVNKEKSLAEKEKNFRQPSGHLERPLNPVHDNSSHRNKSIELFKSAMRSKTSMAAKGNSKKETQEKRNFRTKTIHDL